MSKQDFRTRSRFTAALLIEHAKAIRIPLLVIVAGIVMTFWVDQIHELFLLLALTDKVLHRVGALLMGAVLGFAVWHTGRTVYRFDVPSLPTLSDTHGAWIRCWVPRLLGASVPLLMMAGLLTVRANARVTNFLDPIPSLMAWCFLIEAVLLLFFVTFRRQMFRNITSLSPDPAQDRRVTGWAELPTPIRAIYALLFLLNAAAILCAAGWPGVLSSLGCLSVILMCAAFFTITGTYLTIQASRWGVPLLSVLLVWAVVLQALDTNDNHHIRLSSAMHSYQSPTPAELQATTQPGTQLPSFQEYLSDWRPLSPAAPVYVVSTEGGGIRAAAWTALVLSELELQTNGNFSRQMLMGSGISGGSLGLAFFAAIVDGERRGVIQLSDIAAMTDAFYEEDFLGPTIETMFLTDFLQRLVPWPVFIDRGERLERGWERAWSQVCRQRSSATAAAMPTRGVAINPAELQICSEFSQPWGQLWASHDVPALFLNSTQVDTGERFVQHPFNHLRSDGNDFFIEDAAVLSTGKIPNAAPLSAVVHNSARFTYISPVGTLLNFATRAGESPRTRQLADGGYFENSGTTTLAELLKFALQQPGTLQERCAGAYSLGSPQCPVRLIHISNDPSIGSMRGGDACPRDTQGAKPHEFYGEVRAPVMALLNTRDARGAAARSSIRSLFAQETMAAGADDHSTGSAVYHLRLCNGQHHLPLGWTLSPLSMRELRQQLKGIVGNDQDGPDRAQFDEIVGALNAVAAPDVAPKR